MKKNIVFIIPSLGLGGGEKSLLNLLEQLDYKCYNVHLLLLKRGGIFEAFIPEEVKIIEIPEALKNFQLPLLQSCIAFLKEKNKSMIWNRLMFALSSRTQSSSSQAEQLSWKYMKAAIGMFPEEYDVAIGYLEKTSNYLCIDCIQAKKKIGWIHTDYNKLQANRLYDQGYFEKFDHIVTVSRECAQVLENNFDQMKTKIQVIKNIVSVETIRKMAQEEVVLSTNNQDIIIVSVGRLSQEKGFDTAIKAASLLKSKGIPIRWYIVGEGKARKELETLVQSLNVEDTIFLVGASANPYKYVSQALLYVQPSRFEGKSIAIDEAKLLEKPIVATRFSTVKDQVTDGVEGITVEMDEISLANGIEYLIKDIGLRASIIDNLKKLTFEAQEEVEKLYALFKRGEDD